MTNSGIIRADAYANPKDPPYSEPGLCACCGQELDKHWVRAHIEGRGPFPAHSECWKKWCEANYPQGVYGPWLALMNENKSLFVKSLVQSIDSYRTEHDGPSSATPRAKRRRSLIDDPLAPTKKFIRKYHAGDSVSQKDLCERMTAINRRARAAGESSPYPMPKGCKFSNDDDDWRRAYLDRDKRSSLCVWLSRRKRDS